jgi:hypothetical protein
MNVILKQYALSVPHCSPYKTGFVLVQVTIFQRQSVVSVKWDNIGTGKHVRIAAINAQIVPIRLESVPLVSHHMFCWIQGSVAVMKGM